MEIYMAHFSPTELLGILKSFSSVFALQMLARNRSGSELPLQKHADTISCKPAVALGQSFILQEESVCVSEAQKEELLSVRSESRDRGDQRASVFVVFISAPGRFSKVLQDTWPGSCPCTCPQVSGHHH